MTSIRVLVGCEFSGVVRDAFAARGHDAWSCDLLPSARPGKHYQCDVREVLGLGWDLFIAHPDCTYLCSSGLHWNKRRPGRSQKTLEALDFVSELLYSHQIPHVALENPQGCISTKITEADQYIQPYDFGEDASKKTGLWLWFLPLLKPTKRFQGRLVTYNGKQVERWSNQTDSGQNRLGPSDDRWAKRAETYPGIADAMADQWGRFVSNIKMRRAA